jgi:TRAP-type mannitol/chloroaromatic compound transport system permease large subunit
VATFRHVYAGASLGMLLCALTLIVVEFIAVFNRTKGDTITETIRALNLPPVVWWMFVGTLIVFLTWFLAHVITGRV